MANSDVQAGSTSAAVPMTFGGVDWSTLVIQDEIDDSAVHVEEDKMYDLLGLKKEDESVRVLRQADNDANTAHVDADIKNVDAKDIDGAALPVDDGTSEEQFTVFDRDNPKMVVGDTFPSMDPFRMALKHYAIKKEFDIKINMSQPKKYMAVCKGSEDGNCPWKITAKKKQEGKTVVVRTYLFHMTPCFRATVMSQFHMTLCLKVDNELLLIYMGAGKRAFDRFITSKLKLS